ncbi:alpha/beta hydrolase [Pollutimonas subterranea]|nr:alpha/beta hydrolase [Pollutimonas subterranea]
MTEQQFDTLADILGLDTPDRVAAHDVIFDGIEATASAAAIADKLHKTDAAIRCAYVIHGPMEFRITVGHRDTHRPPGATSIAIGDTAHLVAHSTEGLISVRVTALPASRVDYYSGVITGYPVKDSRYQIGNGVRFSEDQVMVEEPRAASRWRPRY